MRRDPESGNIHKNDNEGDVKYTIQIKALFYMLIALTILRLFSLEIMAIFSDGIGALMVYCFLYGRGRCMALFLIINAVMGLIVGVSRLIGVYNAMQLANYSTYLIVLFSISLYAVIVYLYEVYIGIIGYRKYTWENMFGANNQNQGVYSQSAGYGAVPSQEQPAAQNRGYVAFAGRGTAVGQ